MKPSARLLLAVAGGILSAFLVGGYVLSVNASTNARVDRILSESGEPIPVWVPAQDVPAGTQLHEGLLREERFLRSLIPANSATELNQLIGATASSMLYTGEIIHSSRLGEVRASSMAAINSGHVAASVPVQDARAAGGAILPGSRVRLFVTSGSGETLLLADELVVLETNAQSAADTSGDDEFSGFGTRGGLSWITLLVPETDAARILNASDTGVLHVTLLPSDEAEEDTTTD